MQADLSGVKLAVAATWTYPIAPLADSEDCGRRLIENKQGAALEEPREQGLDIDAVKRHDTQNVLDDDG